MKVLKKLKINDFEAMTDKEMKQLVGGGGSGSGSGSVSYFIPKDTPSYFSCSCNHGASRSPFLASWTKIYFTSQEMLDDIIQKCYHGGSCNKNNI